MKAKHKKAPESAELHAFGGFYHTGRQPYPPIFVKLGEIFGNLPKVADLQANPRAKMV